MDAIARSMVAAPPDMTLAEWARTTPEGRMLTVMRKLTEPQQEAWVRGMRRIVAGEPMAVVALQFCRECGLVEGEAVTLVERVVGGGA